MKIKIFNFKMSSEETKILKFTEYQKFDKLSFIIYVDLQSLIKKIEKFKYNFEKTVTTKVREHTSLYVCIIFKINTMFREVKTT